MKYEIIDSKWWTPPLFSIMSDAAAGLTLSIGAVAIRTKQGKWKVYIGFGHGLNELNDTEHIASVGMPLDKSSACGMFPSLNPDEWTS